jgi:hypothetical protein
LILCGGLDCTINTEGFKHFIVKTIWGKDPQLVSCIVPGGETTIHHELATAMGNPAIEKWVVARKPWHMDVDPSKIL